MGIMENLLDALDTSSLSDWTTVNGGATRIGSTITSTGNTLWYTRSNQSLEDKSAFLFEAVLTAENLVVDEERGARMWVAFSDPSVLMPGDVWRLEVRLHCEMGTSDQIKLWDVHADTAVASLNKPWSGNPIRIRLKRQTLGSTDYVFLQAEDATTWEDPPQNNILNDSTKSMAVAVSTLLPAAGSCEFGFGHKVVGSYSSDWESVHITTCDDAGTVLPYWPPAPLAPTLAQNTTPTVPEEVDASVDTSAGFLANDMVSGTLTTVKNGTKEDGPDATGAAVVFHFDGLGDGQNVSCAVTAREVSGRETVGPASAPLLIPDVTAPAKPIITSPSPGIYSKDPRIPLSGDAEPGARVDVYDDTGTGPVLIGDTTADPSGMWSFTPSSNLSEGVHVFTAKAVDAANNESPASDPVDVDLHLTPPQGEIVVTTDLGPYAPTQVWVSPATGQKFAKAVQVGLRIDDATFQYLDYRFSSNPLVAANPGHQPPSKLMIKAPGNPSFTDYFLDETNEFSIHAIGSPTTHWLFVWKNGGTDPVVFDTDGSLELQAFLQDFATNAATLPATPLQLDLEIPPEGIPVIQIAPSTDYVPIPAVVRARPAMVGIKSQHADIDEAASSITVINLRTLVSASSALGTVVSLGGGEYLYPAANQGIFPAGVKIDDDDDYQVTAILKDHDTPPNVNTISILQGFRVDTEAPIGEIWIGPSTAGPFSPAQTSHTVGTYYVALAVPKSINDVDKAASTLLVQPTSPTTTAQPLSSLSAVQTVNYWFYVWPDPITAAGSYSVDYQLWDTPAATTLGAQHGTIILGQPSFSIQSSGLLLSHTADDGTAPDPNGEIWNGAGNSNYMGVRIHNGGTAAGDCGYRLFIVPNFLFSNASDWILVNEGSPAPVVPNIPVGLDKSSTSNRNFQEGSHPNFPPSSTLFGSGGIGSIVHTCTAGVLHSPQDPLELRDAGGNPVPITDAQFNDPGQFRNAVMNVIQSYNGGGYWTAVSQNPKIANRNFNFKKVV
ncbi:MAG: Ig-like domain-containing protein [Polyangia bacterium]|jgi:hypothetical protein|nr:Ig-like domain-containing protein [Polyangia bacterium]